MTINFNNVYIKDYFNIAGPFEKKGPLGKGYNTTTNDFYFGELTFEKSESKMIKYVVENIVNRNQLSITDLDCIIGGDLLNQLSAHHCALRNNGVPFIGLYSACSISAHAMINAGILIEHNYATKIVTTTSSHNLAAEKQFRYPNEYGGPKPKVTTFTSTGAVAFLLTNQPSDIKVLSGTIGSIIDMNVKDAFNMGAAMAPAAADTLALHLENTNTKISDYDLIITGDLGRVGKNIFKDYYKKVYKRALKNYDDAATMIYNYKKQDIYAGGSGCACLPLVLTAKILKEKKYKKILFIATGSLHSQTMVLQKESIPAIAYAVSLEVK